jgi:hypothetical protein
MATAQTRRGGRHSAALTRRGITGGKAPSIRRTHHIMLHTENQGRGGNGSTHADPTGGNHHGHPRVHRAAVHRVGGGAADVDAAHHPNNP